MQQQNPPNHQTPHLRRALPQYGDGPLPGAPSTPAADPLPAQQAPHAATPLDTTIKADSILTQEFMHASGSAHQLRDHSNSLFNFFLISAGALSTGLGVIVNIYKNGSGTPTLEFIQVLLLAAGALLAFVIFIRFIQLSQEYRENLLTMNLIKEFYITHLRREMPEVDRAFRSPLRVVKDPNALSSNGLLGLTVAGLGSLSAAGAAGHFMGWIAKLNHWTMTQFGDHFFGLPPFVWETVVFFVAFGAQILYSRKYLKEEKVSVR